MAAKQDSESTRNVIATNDTMDKPSIITSGVNLYHHIFCMMMRSVMVTVYGRHGKSMPQIDDSLLLDSASALAEKIRTNQVNRHFSFVHSNDYRKSTVQLDRFSGDRNRSDECIY